MFLLQFCTFLGACLVPFSCLTVWELTKSTTAAGIAGALILFGKFESTYILCNKYLHLCMWFQIFMYVIKPFFRRRRNDYAEPIHTAGSDTFILHFGCDICYGKVYEFESRWIQCQMVDLVGCQRSFPRMRLFGQICWPFRHYTVGS